MRGFFSYPMMITKKAGKGLVIAWIAGSQSKTLRHQSDRLSCLPSWR